MQLLLEGLGEWLVRLIRWEKSAELPGSGSKLAGSGAVRALVDSFFTIPLPEKPSEKQDYKGEVLWVAEQSKSCVCCWFLHLESG